MFKKLLQRSICCALGLSVPVLVGCDKLKTAISKLEKAKSSGGPVVQGKYSSDQISDIGPAEYATLISRKNALVIVDYHAEWCGPCKSMGPVLEKAAQAHPGVVFLGKVDVDKASSLAGGQGVSSIPDVRFFKDGKQVGSMIGFPGEKQVLAKVDELAAGIRPAEPAPAAAGGAPSTGNSPAAPKGEINPASKDWLPAGMNRR